jgi:hypothetical protein
MSSRYYYFLFLTDATAMAGSRTSAGPFFKNMYLNKFNNNCFYSTENMIAELYNVNYQSYMHRE